MLQLVLLISHVLYYFQRASPHFAHIASYFSHIASYFSHIASYFSHLRFLAVMMPIIIFLPLLWYFTVIADIHVDFGPSPMKSSLFFFRSKSFLVLAWSLRDFHDFRSKSRISHWKHYRKPCYSFLYWFYMFYIIFYMFNPILLILHPILHILHPIFHILHPIFHICVFWSFRCW